MLSVSRDEFPLRRYGPSLDRAGETYAKLKNYTP
jgi:hypothetical protein